MCLPFVVLVRTTDKANNVAATLPDASAYSNVIFHPEKNDDAPVATILFETVSDVT
jgi:hypothetical protein